MSAADPSRLAVAIVAMRPIRLVGVPTWVLALVLAAAIGALVAATLRIFPPWQRRGQARRLGHLLLFAVLWVVASGFQRTTMWLGIVTVVSILPWIWFYGPLPDDFPPPGDARRRSDPRHREIARRGGRIGIALCMSLAIGWSAAFVLVKGP